MNMLTIVILFVLFLGTYSGYKNGLMTGLLRTIGYTASFILAMDYYKVVRNYIYMIVPYPSPFFPNENPYYYYDEKFMFTLDESYYYILSFLAILLGGWLVTRLVTQLLSYFTEGIAVPRVLDGVGGGIIGFVVHYLGIFLILLILSTIPYDFIQNRISKSIIGDTMLTSTPVVSERSYQIFIEDVFEEVDQNRPLMDLEPLPEKEESNE